MDNVWNEYFLLSYLKESELEEKYRAEGYTHMIVNGYEVRWPKGRISRLRSKITPQSSSFRVERGSRWAMKSRNFKEVV